MDWVENYRQQFPVTKRCTYMDSAYDCGGSYIGRNAADRYFNDWAEAAATAAKGGPGREPFFAVADEARAYLGQLLGGVSPENIALTKNTNEGINLILQGFDFEPDANVVTVNREYPSVVIPCLTAQETRGIACKFAAMPEDEQIPVDLIWDQVDAHTAMVLVSHVQSSSGYKIDLAELGRRCYEQGVFLVVDAVQSLGLNECNAREWHLSAVSAASYKGLGGFISTGFLYCCDELLQQVRPVFGAHNFETVYDKSGPVPTVAYRNLAHAAKLENCSIDYLGAYVLRDALAVIVSIGIDEISRHISDMYEMLYDGFRELGYSIVTPRCTEHRCASMKVLVEDGTDACSFFRRHGVILTGKQNFLRISLGAYSNEADVRKTLETAAEYARNPQAVTVQTVNF